VLASSCAGPTTQPPLTGHVGSSLVTGDSPGHSKVVTPEATNVQQEATCQKLISGAQQAHAGPDVLIDDTIVIQTSLTRSSLSDPCSWDPMVLEVETCQVRRVVLANTPMVLDPVLEMVIFKSEPDTIRSVGAPDKVTSMTPVSMTVVDPVFGGAALATC
jgi:hypothetical protein